MILFNRKNHNKDPKNFIGDLLREMYFTNESTTLEKIISHIESLKECMRSFASVDKYSKNKLDFLLESKFIHHSTLIENNSIDKNSVRLILGSNKVIPHASLNEHIEIINLKEALDYIKECIINGVDLSRDVLLNTHHLVLKGIDTKNAGIFRNCEVSIYRSDYKPPKPEELEERMYKYFQYYNTKKSLLDVIELATEIHGRLCFIKPFTDCNGIIARLFMNYLLMKEGYPIVNISGNRESKIKYFQALEEFPTNPKVFHKFTAMCVYKSLCHYIKNIALIAPKGDGKYFYEEIVKKCGFESKSKLISLLYR